MEMSMAKARQTSKKIKENMSGKMKRLKNWKLFGKSKQSLIILTTCTTQIKLNEMLLLKKYKKDLQNLGLLIYLLLI